jgi:hypothetical protein
MHREMYTDTEAAPYAGTAPVNQTGEPTFKVTRRGKFIR